MEESDNKPSQKLLERLIERGTPRQYHIFFQKYHEADIAEVLEEIPFEKRYQFFLKAKPEIAVEILEQMGLGNQIQLIIDFKTDLATKFIEEMEVDNAVDLLEELFEEDEEKAHEILSSLPEESAEEIGKLLASKEDSAQAIMTSDYLAIPEAFTVQETIAWIKKQELPENEASFYLFTYDKDNKISGFITLKELLIKPIKTKISEIKNEVPVIINKHLDQEEVAKLFRKYDMSVLPVINEHENIIGIITIDDIMDVMVEEATEDIYKLTGTGNIEEEKLVSGKISFAVKSRIIWILLPITGGFLASFLINFYSHHFKDYFFSLAISLSFLPMLLGLGGNVANQSATIVVRGLATGLVRRKYLNYILRELFIGLSIGVIISSIVVTVNLITGHPLLFSFILFVAMIIDIITAAIIGSALPIIFKAIKIDPAVASAPFIATTLDVIGQIIYFSLILGTILFLI